MKRGSEYAKRIKQLFQQMLKKVGKPELSEPLEPIQQLIIGILAENTSEAKAAAVFKRICEQMVDLNELRVTPALELAELIGSGVPQAREKSERIVRVLNEIRQRQDTLDLSFLKQRGRREAREYLESLEGVGASAAASVVVHSLGGHAIPVDYLTIYVLRKEDAVDGEANLAEVQSFLERHVGAGEVRLFATVLSRHVAAEGARVQISRLPEMLNLAPPEPLKPIKRQGMEKPKIPGAAKEEELPVIPDLDAGDLGDVVLGEPDLEAITDDGDELVHKPPAPAAPKKSKKASAAPAPASKPAAELRAKSKKK
jgi:endonuclease III